VFVEMERNRHVPKQIMELVDGIARLTALERFKFRYYKSFKSLPADEETLTKAIPVNTDEYEDRVANNEMNNFSNFFNRSFIENIDVLEDDIRFEKMFSESIKMKIKDFGIKEEVYNKIPGKLKMESKDVSEILFLTKFIGDYNITKIDNTFVFENNGYAVALERE
jgi:GR25 family glycosyltransferase involved in LPS biosynthesis